MSKQDLDIIKEYTEYVRQCDVQRIIPYTFHFWNDLMKSLKPRHKPLNLEVKIYDE